MPMEQLPPDVKKVNAQRFRMLEVLYTSKHHNKGRDTLRSPAEVQADADLDEPSYERAFRFLKKVGYVAGNAHGGVDITIHGMIAYEAARAEPDKKTTEAFPPVNIFLAETVTNSTVQMAGQGSTQEAKASVKGGD